MDEIGKEMMSNTTDEASATSLQALMSAEETTSGGVQLKHPDINKIKVGVGYTGPNSHHRFLGCLLVQETKKKCKGRKSQFWPKSGLKTISAETIGDSSNL